MLYVFNKSEVLILSMDNTLENSLPYFEAVNTDKLNENNTFTFKVPIGHPDSDKIIEGNYVAFKDLEGTFQMFEMVTVEESHTDSLLKYAYCENVSNELLDEFFIYQKFTSSSPTTIMNALLSGTRWSLGTTNVITSTNLEVIRGSVSYWIATLRAKLRCDIKYYVQFTGTTITGRKIDLLIRRGSNTNLRFEYGRNLKEIKRTVDMTNVKTALYGYGAAIKNATTGKGDRTSFKNTVWTTPTNPANKPAGQEYIEDPAAKALYGYAGGTRNRFGKFDDKEIKTASELIEATWDMLQDNNAPKITYECKISDIDWLLGLDSDSPLLLGDTIKVIDTEFNPNLALEAEVIEIKRNLNDEENGNITLGSFKKLVTDDGRRVRYVQRDLAEANLSIPTPILNGDIDTLPNPVSSYSGFVYITDGDGIVIYNAVTKAAATKALRLRGGAWAIANTKDGFGEFIYTTAATGDGITAEVVTTGELNANLVTIRGDTYFFWSGLYLKIQKPSDANAQIRLGKYDGTNYGIAFTRDNGATFNTIMDWDGVLVEDAEFRLVDESGIENIIRSNDNLVNNSSFELTIRNSTSGDAYETYLVLYSNGWSLAATGRVYLGGGAPGGKPLGRFGEKAAVINSTSIWSQTLFIDWRRLYFSVSAYATSYPGNSVTGTARIVIEILSAGFTIATPSPVIFTITSGNDFNWVREAVSFNLQDLTYVGGYDYTDASELSISIEPVTASLKCLVDGVQCVALPKPNIYNENIELVRLMTGTYEATQLSVQGDINLYGVSAAALGGTRRQGHIRAYDKYSMKMFESTYKTWIFSRENGIFSFSQSTNVDGDGIDTTKTISVNSTNIEIQDFILYFLKNTSATSNQIASFRNYTLYSDDTGFGTAGNRLWISGPDEGEVRIGPRTVANFWGRFQVKSRYIEFLMDSGSGKYIMFDNSFTGGSGTEPVIHPDTDLFGQLGTTSLRWYRGYAGAWLTSSSIEIKDDVIDEDKEEAYNLIKNTPIHKYKLKKEKDAIGNLAPYYVGAVAEECNRDFTDEDGKNINLYSMISILMAGNQKLIADKEILETKVTTLENDYAALLKRVEDLEKK